MTNAPGAAPAPDTTPDEAPEERSSRRLELFAAIILGIAAILTAISAYKAALSDGNALQGYTESTRTLNDSGTFYAQSNQAVSNDQALFVQYAVAARNGDDELTAYIKANLMEPNLRKAVDWWESKEGAAKSPFVDESPYTYEDGDEARRLEKEADKQFKAGSKADNDGDKFELASVLLAITLFLGGIATLFKRRPTKILMLGISTISLGVGAVAFALAYTA